MSFSPLFFSAGLSRFRVRAARCARIIGAAMLGCLPLGSAFAAETDKPAIPFALGRPVIVKADWRSELLRAGDFNGDGRTDFLTVNNAKGLLEIFLQNPEGEREPFAKREEILDFRVDDVATGDFNADGRTDLVIASRNRNIILRCQKADGTFGGDFSLDAPALYVRTADLDRDGNPDLVALAEDRMTILYGPILLPGKTPEDAPIPAADNMVSFFNAAAPGSPPLIGDFNGDGLDDIAYVDAQRRNRILVRFQTAPRRWGLESSFETANAAGLAVLRASRPASSSAESGDRSPDLLALIDFTTREARLYRFEQDTTAFQQTIALSGPYFLSSDPKSLTSQETVIAADLRGDGKQDLVSASAKAPEISLYLQDEGGRLRAMSAPSLSNITALAVVPRPEGDLVFSLSDKEETIGASRWDPARGLSVPEVFNARRKPLAMAAGDLQGDGKKDLLFLYREENERIALGVFQNPFGIEALREGPLTTRSLPAEKDLEPTAMVAADLNGDGLCDLLIFQRYNPARVFLQNPDGGFRNFSTDQGIQRGVFNRVLPAQIQIADLSGDGNNEILIARENFARAYRIEKDDELRLVEQFNGRNASSVIASVTAADLDGDGHREVVLLDSANQVLTIYKRSESGEYSAIRHHETQGLRGARLIAVDVNHNGREDLLACEEGRPHLYYSGESPPAFKAVWRRAPEERERKYASVWALDLLEEGSAGAEQLMALEGTDHRLEFFAGTPDNPDQPEMFFRFKMFDDERSVSQRSEPASRPEPRDALTADVNGNGRKDLVVLAHDNILYYPQTTPAD